MHVLNLNVECPATSSFASYSLFDGGGNNAFDNSWKNLRDTSIAPDTNIRAIFDNTNLFEGFDRGEPDLTLSIPNDGHGVTGTIHPMMQNDVITSMPLDIWTTGIKAPFMNGSSATGSLHDKRNVDGRGLVCFSNRRGKKKKKVGGGRTRFSTCFLYHNGSISNQVLSLFGD